ncbi:uncharacterized protein LOC112346805 [Selaginella moellendorffii]|uniref:uncharacterized protein LOC112346805 n=1 Tax=Selaginella moellendorffii TaxID=88036 RepID=UPI000D1C9CC5|nr:uncharacterized protein LOC112346805 [Selaginella moellendorffii]|eukprot:XP_024532267.1 uncharacterized protein LOC112346805 [Selaginella moellendorffii]
MASTAVLALLTATLLIVSCTAQAPVESPAESPEQGPVLPVSPESAPAEPPVPSPQIFGIPQSPSPSPSPSELPPPSSAPVFLPPSPSPLEALSPTEALVPAPAPSPASPPPLRVPTSFCARSVLRKTCPNPPTFDYIQLPDYAGKWYEIGATATSKLLLEAGTICNQAVYAVPNTSSFAQAPNMSVTNVGLHVAGPLTSLGVQQVAAAAGSACSGARTICDRVANDSHTTRAAVELASVAAAIEQGNFAAELLELQDQIFSAIGEMEATLDLFSPCMESIQRLDGDLSQAEIFANATTPEQRNATLLAQGARLEALDGLLDQANALVDSLRQSVHKMTQCTPKIVNISAQLLFVGDLESSVRLTSASTDLSTTGDAILSQVLAMRLTLKGIAAARGLIDLAISTASPNTTAPSFDTSAGFAIQNVTSPGKLKLQLAPSIAAPVPPPAAPYWVLSLRGRAMQGYRASLVYSCSQNKVTGTIHQGMFILSRTPSLPQKIVGELLQLSAAFGINNDCDDPFLYTVHHGKTCAMPPSE